MKAKLTLCLLLVGAGILQACGAPGPPLPPSLELPKPVTDLRATRKGHKVVLVWSLPLQTTDRQNLRRMGKTSICRSLQVGMTKCQEVGEVPTSQLIAGAVFPKSKHEKRKEEKKHKNETPAERKQREQREKPVAPQVTFEDSLPENLLNYSPEQFANYAVETLNTRGRSAGLSNQVQVPLVPTLPPPSEPTAEVGDEGVRLSWKGVLPEQQLPDITYRYRVYRRAKSGGAEVIIGEQPIAPTGTLLDTSMAWEQTHIYRVTTVTIVSRSGNQPVQLEGEDSPPVEVFVHDIYPPAVPTGLQAVFSSVGQRPFVDLTWAPNPDTDFAGYNVYRREVGGQPARLNSQLVTVPSFRDNDVASGRKYFYSVSAVDVRGNESARSEEASETIPR